MRWLPIETSTACAFAFLIDPSSLSKDVRGVVRAVSATWTGTIIVDAFDAKTMTATSHSRSARGYLLGSSAGFTYVSTKGP